MNTEINTAALNDNQLEAVNGGGFFGDIGHAWDGAVAGAKYMGHIGGQFVDTAGRMIDRNGGGFTGYVNTMKELGTAAITHKIPDALKADLSNLSK